MVVQNYTVFAIDIRPKGFRCIEFDEYITDDTIAETLRVIDDKGLQEEMCQKNFDLAREYFSYRTLRYKITALLANAFGPEYAWIPEID